MEKSFIIYKHTSPSGKVYIGQTCRTIEGRSGKNGINYLHSTVNDHFKNAIKKYGWDAFAHEVLYEGLTLDEANSLEEQLIAEYDATNPQKGYNSQNGGKNHTPNSETIEKLREASSGENNPMYGLRGELSPVYGRKHTEEELKKQSASIKGRFAGENHPFYGKHLSEEHRKHIGDSNRGISKTEEHKAKISKAKKGKPGPIWSDERRMQASIFWKGREFTDETRSLMSKNHADVSGGNNPRARKVRCVETGQIFSCGKDAAMQYNVTKSSLLSACRGDTKTCAGLHWEFIEKEIIYE